MDRRIGYVVAACVCLLVAERAAADHTKHVLVIHSYSQGYQWTDDINRGILDVFASNEQVELHFEYMDANRYSDQEYLIRLSSLYRLKYRDSHARFEAIIVSDDNAFDFVLQHRDDLFPNVPVVFCGINDFAPSRIKGLTGITGVNEQKSVRETLDVGLLLRPQTQRIAVVAGARLTEQLNLAAFERIAPDYADRYEIVYLTGLEADDLQEALRALPVETLVLFTSYLLSPSGRSYSWQESIEIVTVNPRLLVLALSDFQVRGGIAGGMVVHGYSQGERAARIAREVIAGHPADSIPPVMTSPNRYVFDDETLRRLGIEAESVPTGSVLLNLRPGALMHRWHNQGVKSFFGYELFENHGTNMLLIEPTSGTIIDANRAAHDLDGYQRLIGMNIAEINTLTPDEIQAEMSSARRLRRNFFAFRHRTAHGTVHDVAVYSWPVQVDATEMLFSVIFDMTDQHTAERLAETQARVLKGASVGGWVVALIIIAVLLVQQRQKRKVQLLLQAELRQKTALLDAIPNPVYFKDAHGTYTSCNRSFEARFGIGAADLRGKTVFDLDFVPDAHDHDRHEQELYAHPDHVIAYESRIQDHAGSALQALIHKAAVTDAANRPVGLVGVITDIGDQKRREEELRRSLSTQKTLIKELYHRTKNNMQVISSILSLKTHTNEDPAVRDLAKDIDRRIRSMALVHQMLYDSGDLSRIELRTYLERLFEVVAKSYDQESGRVHHAVTSDEIHLLIDYAVPVGLVVNELISNSFKHAFSDNRAGHVRLLVQRNTDGTITMHYRDDGVGYRNEGRSSGPSQGRRT